MADVSINAVSRRVQYTGNTGTGPYAFTFNILADADLAVYKGTTRLTLAADYTVSTNADGTGSITLTDPLVSSDLLTILGARLLERTVDFVAGGDFFAASVNEQMDSQVIMAQQLDEKLSRSLKVNPGDEFTDLELPLKADRKGAVLGFNAITGDPEAGPAIADVSSLADITADIATLADIEDGTEATGAIQTLAGISSSVTTVAGSIASVNTAASNITDIQNASTNAATATTQATEAANSALNAATSATSAADAQTAAETARDQALTSADAAADDAASALQSAEDAEASYQATISHTFTTTSISDIDNTSRSDGSVLVYNGTTSKYVATNYIENDNTVIKGGNY